MLVYAAQNTPLNYNTRFILREVKDIASDTSYLYCSYYDLVRTLSL
jgi:hypothetical protein